MLKMRRCMKSTIQNFQQIIIFPIEIEENFEKAKIHPVPCFILKLKTSILGKPRFPGESCADRRLP